MRKFLVGASCVIVGLQVVAAVVVVIGLAVLAAAGGVRFPTHLHYDRPADYSDLPTPASPTIQSASWDAPAEAVSPAALDPRVESILQYREQVGSPLAGTILEGDPASPETHREVSSILAEVSARAPADVPSKISPTEPTVDLAPTAEPLAPSTGELVNCPNQPASPLAAAVEHLYHQASRHESQSEYERADRLRELARQLRTEIGLGSDASRPVASPALPPQESARPENPAELPATESETAESVIPPS